MDKQIRIIIADDKPLLREGFVSVLKDFNIVTIGQAANGAELLDLLKTLLPDVILLDLSMPVMDGSTTFNHLKTLYPKLKVIILSGFNESLLIEDYIKRGVDGYVTKDEISGDGERFAKLIRQVHYGAKKFSKNTDNRDLKLTEIQKDILQLEGTGHEKNDIAEITGLTKDAINKQKRKLMEKLGVKTVSAFYIRLANSGFAFLRRPPKRND